jgi:hypothetical protein
LGVTRQTLNNLVNGKRGISAADIAIRLDKAFGGGGSRGCDCKWPTTSRRPASTKAAIGKRVTVFDYPNGRLAIRYKGVELAYRTFDKIRQIGQGAIADNKRLGPVLAMIRDEQLRRGRERRGGPRRRDQRDARLFN